MDKKNKRSSFVYLLALFLCFSPLAFSQQKTKYTVKERLNEPFGTVVKLNIEIVDGDSLQRKEFGGIYLLKILKINGQTLKIPITIEFEDRTGDFPSENFSLFEHIFGRSVNGSISSKVIDKMKVRYVGKRYNIEGYESGEFTGNPDYSQSEMPQILEQNVSFHFKNYIVIVHNLDNQKNPNL